MAIHLGLQSLSATYHNCTPLIIAFSHTDSSVNIGILSASRVSEVGVATLMPRHSWGWVACSDFNAVAQLWFDTRLVLKLY